MNKVETVNAITDITGIGTEKCIKVVDSLEVVLTHELEGSGGVRKFFERTSLLLDFLKRGQVINAGKKVSDMVGKVAQSSETSFEESQQVLGALVDIMDYKQETSKSARIKFKTVSGLAGFFRHK